MAARVLLRSLLHAPQNYPQKIHFPSNVLAKRGLKDKLLFKKTKNRKMKVRDGKEYTVEHMFWENYFKGNPEILESRAAANMKNIKPLGSKPMRPNKIFETLTSSDKRLAYAAVFLLISGFIAMKITFA